MVLNAFFSPPTHKLVGFCLFVIDGPDFGTHYLYLCSKNYLFPIFISDNSFVLSNTLPTRERRQGFIFVENFLLKYNNNYRIIE